MVGSKECVIGPYNKEKPKVKLVKITQVSHLKNSIKSNLQAS